MLRPKSSDYCRISSAEKPKLIVVIDTEEEFDWSASFSRSNISVKAMRSITAAQDIFDAYQITPVYVIDYAVASQAQGYGPLQDIHADGKCLIGTHVHPWVNPPFDEQVSIHNSFLGNLPPELEEAKLKVLGEMIAERFGEIPVIYKAGRYGIGANSARILEQEGYEVDLSVCPFMDYSSEGGPDFSTFSAWPYWFGLHRQLLELPLTTGFTGLCRRWGFVWHDIASRSLLAQLRADGILARLRMVNKVWLSPEGYTLKENIDLIRSLYRDGLRVFSFAFHSPSLEPGHTPYVRTQSDLDKFLSHCKDFFDFFIDELGGEVTTPLMLKSQLLEPKLGQI